MECPSVIKLERLNKSFTTAAGNLPILKDISVEIARGEFVAIMGPSGSGKSTLLNVLGCLDGFDTGRYLFGDISIKKLDTDALAALRCKAFGFVFQNFNLVSQLNAWRNVELPLIYSGKSPASRKQIAIEKLEQMGLGERVEHKPVELSGGQQQRVAIARALINEPDVIIADEPTGSLDSQTGQDIMRVLANLHQKGTTIVMVTHENEIASFASRLIHLRDGRITEPGA